MGNDDDASTFRQLMLSQLDFVRDVVNPGAVANHARAPTPKPEPDNAQSADNAQSDYLIEQVSPTPKIIFKRKSRRRGEIIDLCSSVEESDEESDAFSSSEDELQSETEDGADESSVVEESQNLLDYIPSQREMSETQQDIAATAFVGEITIPSDSSEHD